MPNKDGKPKRLVPTTITFHCTCGARHNLRIGNDDVKAGNDFAERIMPCWNNPHVKIRARLWGGFGRVSVWITDAEGREVMMPKAQLEIMQ